MTPFRASLALLAALLSLDTAAQLSTSIATAASGVATGGTIAFTGEVRNTHSSPLSFGYTFSVDEGRIVAIGDPNCGYVVHYLVQCSVRNLAAGAAIPFRFTAQATNDEAQVGQVLSASVTASTVIPDDQPVFSSAHEQVPIARSPARVDLAVTVSPGSFDPQPQPLDAIEQTVTVTNLGPAVAAPVTIAFDASGAVRALRLVSASAPWTCTPDPGPSVHFACTISRLGAGETSTLRLRLSTTVARSYSVQVTAWTAGATDPNLTNSIATGSIVAGTAADFARVLVPVLANETPGARATWTSHLSAMASGQDATLFFCTVQCDAGGACMSQCLTNGLALGAGRTERIWPGALPGAAPQGVLMYVERGAEPRTAFSGRLSSSRSSEARGVELPVVRESEFRTDRLVLPGIRLDAEHRFLLRVYDPDALPGSGVTIRLFEGFLSRVLAEVTLPLTARQDTLFSLPAFPGYTQTSAIFDPVLPASGSRDVGLEILGLRPGQKIWAFVSATENAGEHVTLITPQ
ncbi:MAG TPA: hypothetical protein VF432_21635 [Thermoanaerobaculia bacterium]